MLSLIAAMVVAQMPAATSPDPAWYWTTIYGQRVQVCGVAAGDGKLRWSSDWRGDARIAPAEAERRKAAAIDQPPLAPTPTPTPSPQAPAVKPLNYGVNVEQMAGDGRTIRASDPETLRLVTQAAAKRKQPRQPEYCEVHGTDKCPNGGGCKPDPPEPEKKPGIVERTEDEVKKLLAYAVAGVLVLAAVFVILQSPKPQT